MLRFYLALFLVCSAVVGGAYGLWYEFGPEGAKADYATMLSYRQSTLTDDERSAILVEARKQRDAALADEEESMRDTDERYRAWADASAQCATDVAFKRQNEALCSGPPKPSMLMIEPHHVASEEQYVEREIMFRCTMFPLTIREARRVGCLPPK